MEEKEEREKKKQVQDEFERLSFFFGGGFPQQEYISSVHVLGNTDPKYVILCLNCQMFFFPPYTSFFDPK